MSTLLVVVVVVSSRFTNVFDFFWLPRSFLQCAGVFLKFLLPPKRLAFKLLFDLFRFEFIIFSSRLSFLHYFSEILFHPLKFLFAHFILLFSLDFWLTDFCSEIEIIVFLFVVKLR